MRDDPNMYSNAPAVHKIRSGALEKKQETFCESMENE